MLKELTLKNFKSFNEETYFTMEADDKRVSEFPDHIANLADNSLLKVTSIYGPNGGGKTNLLDALRLLKIVVNNSRIITSMPMKFSCYFNKNKDIEINTFFVKKDYEIGYSIVFNVQEDFFDGDILTNDNINEKYTQNFEIKEEIISYRIKDSNDYFDIIRRKNDDIVFCENLLNLGLNNIIISRGKSALSKMFEDYTNSYNNNILEFNIINSLFEEINSIKELHSMRLNINLDFLMKNKDALVSYLNKVDINIKDIVIYKNKIDKIYFKREIKINNKDVITEMPLGQESDGTKKIFFIFLKIMQNKEKSCIYLADDMNAFLHPKLYRAIIDLFNSNKNNNQLIFNSHDIINMNNTLFRRDEIWFAFRNENYSSRLVPLSSIVNYKNEQIRKDAVYSKQYLEGKYGADPFIKKGMEWFNEK